MGPAPGSPTQTDWHRYLCLVTVIKNDEARDKKGLIDYNCHIFQDALNEVFARGWDKAKAQKESSQPEQPPPPPSTSAAQNRLEAQLAQ